MLKIGAEFSIVVTEFYTETLEPVVDVAHARRTQAAEEALAGFDEAERKRLADMLLRIIANVEDAANTVRD